MPVLGSPTWRKTRWPRVTGARGSARPAPAPASSRCGTGTRSSVTTSASSASRRLSARHSWTSPRARPTRPAGRGPHGPTAPTTRRLPVPLALASSLTIRPRTDRPWTESVPRSFGPACGSSRDDRRPRPARARRRPGAATGREVVPSRRSRRRPRGPGTPRRAARRPRSIISHSPPQVAAAHAVGASARWRAERPSRPGQPGDPGALGEHERSSQRLQVRNRGRAPSPARQPRPGPTPRARSRARGRGALRGRTTARRAPRPQPTSTTRAGTARLRRPTSRRSTARRPRAGRAASRRGPRRCRPTAGAAEPAVEPAVRRRRGLELVRRVGHPPARAVRRGEEPVGVRRRRELATLQRGGARAGRSTRARTACGSRPSGAGGPSAQEAAEDVEAAHRPVALDHVDLERARRCSGDPVALLGQRGAGARNDSRITSTGWSCSADVAEVGVAVVADQPAARGPRRAACRRPGTPRCRPCRRAASTSSIESSSGATCSALRVSKVCASRSDLSMPSGLPALVDHRDPLARRSRGAPPRRNSGSSPPCSTTCSRVAAVQEPAQGVRPGDVQAPRLAARRRAAARTTRSAGRRRARRGPPRGRGRPAGPPRRRRRPHWPAPGHRSPAAGNLSGVPTPPRRVSPGPTSGRIPAGSPGPHAHH